MTEQIRLRIDRELAEAADAVCREIGITPTAAVSMFFAQMVKLRGLPFRPSDFPALDEYGVTLAQARRRKTPPWLKSRRRATRAGWKPSPAAYDPGSALGTHQENGGQIAAAHSGKSL